MEELGKLLMQKENKELIGKTPKILLPELTIFLFQDTQLLILLDLDYGNHFLQMSLISIILTVEIILRLSKQNKEQNILQVFCILMILLNKEKNFD